jgi:hypothetical protein
MLSAVHSSRNQRQRRSRCSSAHPMDVDTTTDADDTTGDVTLIDHNDVSSMGQGTCLMLLLS